MNKHMPILILSALMIMLVLSWQSVLNYNGKMTQEYEKHIAAAEKYESKKIYIDAITEYKAAQKIRPEYDIQMKIADLYMKQNDISSYIGACREAVKIDKSKPEPYLIIADYYIEKTNYTEAYSILKQGKNAIGENGDISERMLFLLSRYNEAAYSYDTFLPWHMAEKNAGFAKVSVGGLYGLANLENKIAYQCEYEDIGLPMNNVIPVKKDGEYYYIDKQGNRKLVTDEPAEYLGSFSGKYAPAKINGVYGYIDKKMKEYKFEYEYAGCFSNGIAAVKKNGKWKIINEQFKDVTGYVFDDIKIDDYGFCSENNVFFAQKDGSYALYDTKGKKLSEDLEDVKIFASEQPAAVKKNGKWGFMSLKGEMVTEPTYDDACSFCVGYAPVKTGGKWGCTDMEGHMVIEAVFDEMQAFSKGGYALAEKDGVKEFVVVKLYE